MGRLSYLLVLLGACSYNAPNVGDDDPPPPTDSAPSDSPPDVMVIPPDTLPPDTLPPTTTTDHVATQDTWLDEQFPNFANGGDFGLLADGAPRLAVALIRFDLSGLEPTATVVSAELHIFTTADEGDTVTVFPVLESWVEGSATWSSRSTGVAWQAAGAAPPSRGNTMIATFQPLAENAEYSPPIDAPTVQGWVTNPSSNFGIAITSVNANGPVFRSRSVMNGKPFLRITHTP